MAQLTFPQIAPLISAGLTAAQIAEHIRIDPSHVRDVTTAQVFRLIVNVFRAAVRDFSGVWEGPLVDAIQASGNPQLIQGGKQLFAQPWSDTDYIRSGTDPEVGYLTTAITQVAQAVVQAPVTPDSVQASMDALTGGERWRDHRDTTAADVQAVIDAEAERVAQQAADAAEAAAREELHRRLVSYLWAKLPVLEERITAGQYASEAELIADLGTVFVVPSPPAEGGE